MFGHEGIIRFVLRLSHTAAKLKVARLDGIPKSEKGKRLKKTG